MTRKLTSEKKEGYSLLLYLSHLCLIFPLELRGVLEDGMSGSFFLKREGSTYSLGEWLELFQSTANYRLQRVVLGEDLPPFSAAAELLDKKISEGGLELELKLS